MQYSEFGIIQFSCKSCRKLTKGKLGEGKAAHFREVKCDQCGKHHEWLKSRQSHESSNPLVDDAELIKKHQPKSENQLDLFSN